MFPRARRHHLIVEEFDRELLVSDGGAHWAHRLNESSSLVWRLCDGERSIDDITRIVTATLDAPMDREVVWLVLGRLEEAHLLEQALLRPPAIGAISRREALAMGLAGAAALLEGCGVDSVTAPSPRAASAAVDSALSSSARVSPMANPSPGPSPFPSLEPSPSPSPSPPPPANCEGDHPASEAINKKTCVQKKSNKDAEKKTAENQTQGDAKEEAQRFADQRVQEAQLWRREKGELRAQGGRLQAQVRRMHSRRGSHDILPVPSLPPRPIGANEVAYTCTWTVVRIECTCKQS